MSEEDRDPFYETGEIDVVINWYVEEVREGSMIVGDPRCLCLAHCLTTGLTAASWDERSRIKNKNKALEMLKLKKGGAI